MRGAAEVTKYLQKGGCRDEFSKDSKKGAVWMRFSGNLVSGRSQEVDEVPK